MSWVSRRIMHGTASGVEDGPSAEPPPHGSSGSGDTTTEAPCNSNKCKSQFPTTLSRKRKAEAQHEEASLHLRQMKLQASERWKQHIAAANRSSGSRMPSIQDTAPGAPSGEGLYQKIHPSHTRMAVRNVIFCKKCGYWMFSKPISLRKPCPGRPAHNGAAGVLARMMKGLHPDKKVATWPDGSSTRIAVPIVSLDT